MLQKRTSTVQKLTFGLEKKYICATVFAIFTIALEVVMEVLIPKIMALVIDVGIKNKNVEYVVRVGLLMIVCSVASLAFGVVAGRFASVASQGFSKNLRKNLFAKIQEFSFSNVDHFSSSSLVTRLTTDVTNAQNTYQMIIRMCIRSPFMLISAMVMSFYINARLSLVFLVLIPVIAIPAFFILKTAFPRFQVMMKKYDALNASVQENLIGIRTVKAFVHESQENEKFNFAADDLRKTQIRAERIIIIAMPLMQLVTYLGIIAILWFGGNMMIEGSLQTGELVSFITYLMQILFSLMMLSMIFVMLVISSASIKRIVEVLDTESDIKETPSEVSESSAARKNSAARKILSATTSNSVSDLERVPAVAFDHVSFSYDKTDENAVLSDISLEIQKGQTIGIFGSTGSGKTSLVNLIPRLYDVTSGTVSVDGKDVRDWQLSELRKNIGVVLQTSVLFSGTIEKNLMWGLENAVLENIRGDCGDDGDRGDHYVGDDRGKIVAACKIACAHDFVSSFPLGYQTELGQGGVNLSGGQKQRLCIARALLKNPEILILDDSTSAVDTATDKKIRQALKNELSDTTKIIIAQRISSIQDADKIFVLEKGQIISSGTHEELLENCAEYREVFEIQSSDSDCDIEGEN